MADVKVSALPVSSDGFTAGDRIMVVEGSGSNLATRIVALTDSDVLTGEQFTTENQNKLSGIEAGAQVNPTSFAASNVTISDVGVGDTDSNVQTQLSLAYANASGVLLTSGSGAGNFRISLGRVSGSISTVDVPIGDTITNIEIDGNTMSVTRKSGAVFDRTLPSGGVAESTDDFTGGSVNNQTGVITLTRRSASNPLSLDLSGFVGAAIDTATAAHVRGATFNTGTGIVQFTGAGDARLFTLDLSSLMGGDGGGGLTSTQVRGLIADWAEEGNSSQIPANKISATVAGAISDWAETGNNDNIPVQKLGNAFTSLSTTRAHFASNVAVGGTLSLADAILNRLVPTFSAANNGQRLGVRNNALEFLPEDENAFSAVSTEEDDENITFTRLDGNSIALDITHPVNEVMNGALIDASVSGTTLNISRLGRPDLNLTLPSGGGTGGLNQAQVDARVEAVAGAAFRAISRGSEAENRNSIFFANVAGTPNVEFDMGPIVSGILEQDIPTNRRIPEIGDAGEILIVDSAGAALEFITAPAEILVSRRVNTDDFARATRGGRTAYWIASNDQREGTAPLVNSDGNATVSIQAAGPGIYGMDIDGNMVELPTSEVSSQNYRLRRNTKARIFLDSDGDAFGYRMFVLEAPPVVVVPAPGPGAANRRLTADANGNLTWEV